MADHLKEDWRPEPSENFPGLPLSLSFCGHDDKS